MVIRRAFAEWRGNLREGVGTMDLGSGAFSGAFSYGSRFESGPGTNPEELIGAAHAGCFSMFLSALLSEAGFPPARIGTTASVHLDPGPVISLIELETEAEVPGLGEEKLQELAAAAKKNCPVSRALAGLEIRMVARLVP